MGDLTGYRFVAGIVGHEDYSGAEINRCVNIGTVTATNTPSTYQREITISNSSKKKPTLNDCMALTDDFGRYTDNNDCEVIDIEDFTSGNFAKRYGLISPSAVKSAVNALLDKDLITQEKGVYQVYDKFLEIWLKR